MPVVSIVVLNLDKSLLTLQCLDSIARTADTIDHEIIVVDNGSGPSELAVLEQALSANVNLVRLA